MIHLLMEVSGGFVELLGLIVGAVIVAAAFGIFIRGAYKKRKDD